MRIFSNLSESIGSCYQFSQLETWMFDVMTFFFANETFHFVVYYPKSLIGLIVGHLFSNLVLCKYELFLRKPVP